MVQVGKTFGSAGIAAAAAAAGISVTAGGGISITPGISMGTPTGSTSIASLTTSINSVTSLASGVTAANVGDLSKLISFKKFLSVPSDVISSLS